MVTLSEGDLAVNGTTLHYYRMGQPAGPPVVLLHGFSDSGLCWLRLATDLADDYSLVMLDAVGHGRSGGPEHGFRERAVGDVLAVMDALGFERPVLIGHSMGAATAAGVAAEAPERVRGLVLEDPPWRDGPPQPVGEADAGQRQGSRAPIGSPAWRDWIRSYQRLSRDEQQAAASEERATWPAIDRVAWADAKAQFNLAVLDVMAGPPRQPWRAIVERITCPVLLVTGDPERGAIVTPAVAHEATGLWRRCQVVHVPGAGHNIRRERYEPFVTAVAAFLKEIARV